MGKPQAAGPQPRDGEAQDWPGNVHALHGPAHDAYGHHSLCRGMRRRDGLQRVAVAPRSRKGKLLGEWNRRACSGGQGQVWLLAGVLGPYVGTQIWWRTCYHSWGAEPGVDTTKYIRWTDGKDGKEGALGRYYKNRRIPMCDLYEHYIEGKFDWNEECEGGDCYLILENHRDHFVNYKTTWNQIWWLICQFLPWWMTGAGLGTGSSSGKSIAETTKEIDEHYNKGNDVFSAMLGGPMVYTCGIFHEMPKFASDGYKGDYAKSAADGALEEAQHNKLQMVCDKLMLQEGESFLDIGCGWGTLVRHAAKFYGAKATGVTLAVEGKKFCDDASKETGVPTDILFCDYRDIPAEIKFDKIASIET